MPKFVDHDARRVEIAAAAVRVVAERGIEGATTAALARAAGCTVGALPHYFAGKDDILLAALRHARQSVIERAQEGWRRSGGRISEILLAALPVDPGAGRDARVWLAFFGRALHEPLIAEEFRKHYRGLEELADALLPAVTLRSGWDRRRVIETAFAFMDGLAMRALVEPESWPESRLRRALETHLASMIEEDVT